MRIKIFLPTFSSKRTCLTCKVASHSGFKLLSIVVCVNVILSCSTNFTGPSYTVIGFAMMPLSVREVLLGCAVRELGKVRDHGVEVAFGGDDNAGYQARIIVVGRLCCVVCDVDVEEFPDSDELLELYMHFEDASFRGMELRGKEARKK
jgi:hypothetical protein